MAKSKILLIEDDHSLAEILLYNLRQAGYDVLHSKDGADGLALAQTQLPQLVVLDLMLPSIDGQEICRRLRSDSRTRRMLILMLTAKSEEIDEVVGLSLGADDYVTKPFSVKILLERIRGLLRRANDFEQPQDTIAYQGLLINLRAYRVTIEGKPVALTRTELQLLHALAEQPERAFSRAELISKAMGEDALVLERTVDVHVRALRLKLGSYARWIETVRGVGYRFQEPSE